MYWIIGILGLFSIIAPFLFGYADNAPAFWTSLLIGVMVIISAYIEGINKDRDDWEYWAAEVLGLFAIVAPFVFGFSNNFGATWTSIVVGLLLAILAGSRLWTGGGSQIPQLGQKS